jgi:hypothetical protein
MVEELTDCVRTLLTAADICQVTTRVLSRQFGSDPVVVRALLTACWMACRAGREVCEEYAPVHDHCRVCARACRAAERACRVLLAVLQGPTYPYSKEGSSDDQSSITARDRGHRPRSQWRAARPDRRGVRRQRLRAMAFPPARSGVPSGPSM